MNLLPGARHFIVTEEPLYAASGTGEHLYVEIEKEGLTTDQVAAALARACGVRPLAVGFAGRKDRHGITRQWFSVLGGRDDQLAGLPALFHQGRVAVLTATRHGNKLRPGHLAGNAFRLGIGGVDDAAALQARLDALARDGIPNRFGTQRFGVHGVNLKLAAAWGAGDLWRAVELAVDPADRWRLGEPVPAGFRIGPEGKVVGALRRRPDDPAGALRAGGEPLQKLIASAAQAAIFNAVLDARTRAGLLHAVRPGDLAADRKGALFLVRDAAEAAEVSARCAAGVFDAFATGPLPGTQRLRPAPDIEAEERAWSSSTGLDWQWFADRGPLESPGTRRHLVVPFRAPPRIETGDGATWLTFGLPSGAYATEVLAAVGIAVPDQRG